MQNSEPAAPLGEAAPRRTILLVEDEEGVRRVIGRYLTAHGFNILAAENARSAEPLWQENRARIDLLLTDVMLPGGVNGRQLADSLRRDKPGLRVIFTSGFSVEPGEAHSASPLGVSFIAKPYQPGELLEAVRAALGTRT